MPAATRSAPDDAPHRTRRRSWRLPEHLACVGLALAVYWPGERLSSTHLTMVAMCLLPVAVRTLLQWEEFLGTAPDQDRTAQDRTAQDGDVYRGAFEHALTGLAILEAEPAADAEAEAEAEADAEAGRIVVRQANRALAAMLRADSPTALRDTPLLDHLDGLLAGERDVVREALTRLATGRATTWHGEVTVGDRWLHLSAAALPRQDDRPARVTLHASDITERRLEEQRLRSLTLHDELTGLPNRTLLLDRLTLALAGTGRSGRRAALLFCDLDAFKAVNDTAGHAAGDAVLVEVARRLRTVVRPGDTVARLGGDEFVVLCPDVPDQATALTIAQRLGHVVEEPFAVAGGEHTVGLSVGLALSWPDATPEQLLARADTAMYSAKRSAHSTARRTARRAATTAATNAATSAATSRDLASTG